MTIYFGDLLWLWCIGYVVTVWRNYMLFQKLLVNIHMVFLSPMKKWHLYPKKHINTSAFCTTKIQICPQKFWNLATLSFFSLKSHFSKIKFLSLSSFFSLEFESHLSQIFNSNLIHALTQIPFHPKLAPPNYAIAPFILAFFHPPLHCTAAIPKYPWSNNHKEPSPSHISHYFIYYLFIIFLQLRELRKSTSKCSVGEFLSKFFFFQFQTYFFLGLFAALSLKFFGFNLNCIVAKATASIWF